MAHLHFELRNPDGDAVDAWDSLKTAKTGSSDRRHSAIGPYADHSSGASGALVSRFVTEGLHLPCDDPGVRYCPEKAASPEFVSIVATHLAGKQAPAVEGGYKKLSVFSAAPDEAERLNRAVYAYLDVLDGFVGELRSRLRSGDLLALLFVPPPLVCGAAAGQAGTATLILYGEKGASETSEPGALEVPDIAATLLYLLGLRLSEERDGQVGWALLHPDLREHLPVGTLASYGRIRVAP